MGLAHFVLYTIYNINQLWNLLVKIRIKICMLLTRSNNQFSNFYQFIDLVDLFLIVHFIKKKCHWLLDQVSKIQKCKGHVRIKVTR